jgi:hypothetical protein
MFISNESLLYTVKLLIERNARASQYYFLARYRYSSVAAPGKYLHLPLLAPALILLKTSQKF